MQWMEMIITGIEQIKQVLYGGSGWPPWLSGSVCAYHHAARVQIPSTSSALCFLQFKLLREKDEDKQKGAGIGANISKKTLVVPHENHFCHFKRKDDKINEKEAVHGLFKKVESIDDGNNQCAMAVCSSLALFQSIWVHYFYSEIPLWDLWRNISKNVCFACFPAGNFECTMNS